MRRSEVWRFPAGQDCIAQIEFDEKPSRETIEALIEILKTQRRFGLAPPDHQKKPGRQECVLRFIKNLQATDRWLTIARVKRFVRNLRQ